MNTNSRQVLIADIFVASQGRCMGGYFLSPMFNVGTINAGDFSLPALLVSLGGAVPLLVVSKLFCRVVGCLVTLIIALTIYFYCTCWTRDSTSMFCTSLRALPFLP